MADGDELVVSQTKGFDLTKAKFSNEDYFVWSQCDGKKTVADISRETGLARSLVKEVLGRLAAMNAIDGLEDSAAKQSESAKSVVAENSGPTEDASSKVKASGNDPIERIAEMKGRMAGDYFVLLGVDESTSKTDIKRAYFKLSKEFHPDRHYSQQNAEVKDDLAEIFNELTVAFKVLTKDSKRSRYLASIGKGATTEQTKADHAHDLFERGVALQSHRQYENALKFFLAAHKSVPSVRCLRRAVDCAVQLEKWQEAKGYVDAAIAMQPRDPSLLRLLSTVHEGNGELKEAMCALEQALDIPTENDAMVSALLKSKERLSQKIG